tara:strand:- start:297 stop:1448 length:1152 start_codon:yes stop_codon:yes gene_type:complete
MGFWDFFKKNEKQIVETEKVSENEFENWLLNKKTKIEKQGQDFLDIVKKKISLLISELEGEISVLRNVNIEEKKVEEKIKLIVKENLNNYINYLEKLMLQLREINNEKEVVEKINFIFTDFQKKSALSYAKATILIGKEMADTKESIKKFFKDAEDIFNTHKSVIEESKIVGLIEIEIKKFNEILILKSEIMNDIEECVNKINNLKEIIKIKEEEIETIKKSEKFIEENKKEQELNAKKQELEKDIDKLSKIINFKALTNFYHSFENEMNMIKKYRENFKETFHKTKGEEIMSLLRESKLQDANILNKIQEIEEKEKEIKNIIIEETGMENLSNIVNNAKSEIESLNSEKIMKEKKSEKLERNKEYIIQLIKTELNKINVELY